jgi:hypothetical protein
MPANSYELPWNLLEAVQAGALSMQEAQSLDDYWVMLTEGDHFLPQSLWPVAQKLYLWETEVSARVQ